MKETRMSLTLKAFVRVHVRSPSPVVFPWKWRHNGLVPLEHSTPIQVREGVGTKQSFPWTKCFATNWGLVEQWQMASLLALTQRINEASAGTVNQFSLADTSAQNEIDGLADDTSSVCENWIPLLLTGDTASVLVTVAPNKTLPSFWWFVLESESLH